MSSYIDHEIFLFFQSVVTGAVLLLIYDVIRALRKVFSHNGVIVAAEDLIYWVCSGLLVFAGIYRTNHGSLRFFLFGGAALGVWLASITISRFFVKIWAWILGLSVIFSKFLIKWLLFPIRRCKIFMYKCAFFIKKRKRGRNLQKERQANWVNQIKREKKG